MALLPLEAAAGSRAVGPGRRTAPLRALSRSLGRPVPSFVLFSVVLLAWHVPALFDATLRSTTLHALEHTLFFCTALLFWKQVIPSPPLHIRLDSPQRVVFLIGGMIVSWVLAVVLALAPHSAVLLLRAPRDSARRDPRRSPTSSSRRA